VAPGPLPTRHDRSESDAPRRDLAKETRSDNATRHEFKGRNHLFTARHKELMDQLVGDLAAAPPADGNSKDGKEGDPVAMRYCFRGAGSDAAGEEFVFKLHPEALFPGHAAPKDTATRPTTKRSSFERSADAEAMVTLLVSAAGSGGSSGGESDAEAALKRVNMYAKGGGTALALASRYIKEPKAAILDLLKLGADPKRAMDGAIFLSEKKQDSGWIMSLLGALESSVGEGLTKAAFEATVRHQRQTGETALKAAVGHNREAMTKQLLEWGAGREPGAMEAAIALATQRGYAATLNVLTEYQST